MTNVNKKKTTHPIRDVRRQGTTCSKIYQTPSPSRWVPRDRNVNHVLHDVAQSTNAAALRPTTRNRGRAVEGWTARIIRLTFRARRVDLCDCIFLPSDFPMVTVRRRYSFEHYFDEKIDDRNVYCIYRGIIHIIIQIILWTTETAEVLFCSAGRRIAHITVHYNHVKLYIFKTIYSLHVRDEWRNYYFEKRSKYARVLRYFLSVRTDTVV